MPGTALHIAAACAALLWAGGASAQPALSTETAAAPAATSALAGGMASFFASEMAGRRTANGEVCDPDTLTAAHRTLPFGSRVRVTNLRTGRSVVVRINDRGPFARGRVIDLSRAAAREIGLERAGHGAVELALVDSGD